ncbi:OmpA family protein [Zobellia galactanivorans]|uniref:OmpA family protein n=1 Tax=Zobellia galactanivorans (strain DSM 12802 / CCUG 47099 / CIP 106680 / NCIMB 13871 / Dsij) TaxID=63186 RepID=UPI001C07008F|nr:OmpA family protein [Zobellia galactanivorans]MBU3027778.1 OmpA family protein [Zobellia galactanivorans]
MKKTILTSLLVLGGLSAKAQSYVGYLTDNYSGVNGLIANPANITDSRFKTDINIAGASTFFSNDYYGLKLGDVVTSDFDFDTDGKKYPKDSNNFFGNADILGPSFMFNLTPTSSLAIFTRGRVGYNVNKINGNTFESISNDFDENEDLLIDEDDVYLTANAWAEVGVTYARVLMNKDQHFLKGGISLKYLQGLGNAYASGKNVTIDYDADGTPLPGGQTTGSIESTGEVNYGHSDNIDDNFEDFEVEIVDGATGFGADLGVVYEWRPDYASYASNDGSNTFKHLNKYKLKFALSISDIGSINYKNGTQNTYDITGTVNEDDFENEDNLEDLLNNLYTQTGTSSSEKFALPTALHFNVDYSLNKSFYLNLNTDFSLRSSTKVNTNRIPTMVSFTPRYESKWFSFYMPVSLIQGSGAQWGAGFRAGPLYIGSGSVMSLLLSDNSKAADVYAGLKIPIYQGKPKDRDGDGILNRKDDCPDEFGPAENNGCPWPDTDGDEVVDKDDKCPEEAGEVMNDGCPLVDSDGDDVLDEDDKCPNEPGAAENEGCPWPDTDNDGVLDKDDECPNEMGTVANKGCPEAPEVTEEVQKQLNDYAKTILFNSGKASIKSESTAVLVDIISILKEYPDAKFSVEGHTDSIGSKATNQKLSESRAMSVRDFLIKNGIDASRLTAVGFGEDKPIASNMYKDGRAQNRRVEINLVK